MPTLVAGEGGPSGASCCSRGEPGCALACLRLSLAISSAKAGEPRAMRIDSSALGCWPAGGMGNRLLGPKRGESASATTRGQLRGESGDGVQPFSTPGVGPTPPRKAAFWGELLWSCLGVRGDATASPLPKLRHPENAKLSSPCTLRRPLPASVTPRVVASVDARGSAQSTPPRRVGVLYCALRASSCSAIRPASSARPRGVPSCSSMSSASALLRGSTPFG